MTTDDQQATDERSNRQMTTDDQQPTSEGSNQQMMPKDQQPTDERGNQQMMTKDQQATDEGSNRQMTTKDQQATDEGGNQQMMTEADWLEANRYAWDLFVVARKVDELLKNAAVRLRFEEMVRQWDQDLREWRRRREDLVDDEAWAVSDIPDDLDEYPLPPPSTRGVTLPEKYASLAAVHCAMSGNALCKSGLVDPWKKSVTNGVPYLMLQDLATTLDLEDAKEVRDWAEVVAADCEGLLATSADPTPAAVELPGVQQKRERGRPKGTANKADKLDRAIRQMWNDGAIKIDDRTPWKDLLTRYSELLPKGVTAGQLRMRWVRSALNPANKNSPVK